MLFAVTLYRSATKHGQGPCSRIVDRRRNTICAKITDALTNPTLVAAIADRVAAAINSSLTVKVEQLETQLGAQDVLIRELQKKTLGLEEELDAQQQYSRRTSIRISGIRETEAGENIENIVATVFDKMSTPEYTFEMTDVNRVRRVGSRRTDPNASPRQIIVQFKTYAPKYKAIRMRQNIKEPMPNVYINEDLTAKRSHLLFEARKCKRAKKIGDCSSADGRVMVKDLQSVVRRITCETDILGYVL